MGHITLSPAYGRDYKNKQAVLDDWNANKDFKVETIGINGRYANKADLQDHALVHIRYDRLRKVLVI